jgi:hypothetical protein
MKGDQMGNLAAYPIQRELPLSNWTGFSFFIFSACSQLNLFFFGSSRAAPDQVEA